MLGEGRFDQGEKGRVDPCVMRLELVRRQIEEGGIDAYVRLVAGVGAAAGQGVACLAGSRGKGRRKERDRK